MRLLHEPLPLLLLQAVVVVAVARAIGLVARRFKQPMVVAETFAGVLLGPSVFGWIAPRASAALFPAGSLGTLGTLAEVGLVLFMFLVGLEVDPALLRGRARASLAISHASIVAPFALGAALALHLYGRLAAPHASRAAFVLFLGAAMSVTAFPVLARVLVERRLLRSRVGAVAIACAAVDDLTAWCILAFVVPVVRASSARGAIATTLLAIGFALAMALLARPALARAAGRVQPRGLSQNVVALVLMGLLLSSWATELIGVHALFGAFVFGAVLPRQGGFAAALAEKLEDLVVVLFLPMFFAYSGLRTQVGLLATPDGWATCALIIACASLGKFGGSALAARATGMGWRESAAVGTLMNTRGLMELIVLNIGLDLGVLSPTLFAMLVLMTLVTTLAMTPLLDRIYPVAQLARELAAELAERPAPDAPRHEDEPFTALACVGGSAAVGTGLVTLGASLAGTGRLYALDLQPSPEGASRMAAGREPGEGAALAPMLERARELGAEARPLSFVTQDPARDICDVAEVKRADVVLLGWRRPLLGAGRLGGTVRDVVRSARADVGVLVDRGLERTGRVLVPYLGREHDAAALGLAGRLARTAGASVTVLHVVRPGAPEGLRREPAAPAPSEVAFTTVSHESPVEAVVAESARGYDLVVVGMGGGRGLEQGSFGARTEAIVRRANTSVLVVRRREPAATSAATTSARLEAETS